LRQAAEESVAVMKNLARFAVHQRRSPHNLSSKHLANCLMSETHPEHGNGFVKVLDDSFGDSGISRNTGARRDYDVRWSLPFNFLECNFVISENAELG